MLSKSEIEKMYYLQKFSLAKIAKMVDVSTPTIANWMNKYNIPRRTISQSLIGRKLSIKHSEKVKKNLCKANDNRAKNGVSEFEKQRLKQINKLRNPNYKHSKETKEKMRFSHLGKKMSNESRKKLSNTRKNKFSGSDHPLYGIERFDIKGENNPNWNGGVTPLYRLIRTSSKYKIWRNACYERDDFTCQHCEKRGVIMNVDHIKPFAQIVRDNNIQTIKESKNCKELWDVNNGRTLCVTCHRKTHTYGRPLKKGFERGISQ